jgi:hypothetical protein
MQQRLAELTFATPLAKPRNDERKLVMTRAKKVSASTKRGRRNSSDLCAEM